MKLDATAVILAGGKSTRMGYDKQEIYIKDRYLIDYQINILKNKFKDVIVISNKLEFYKNRDVKVYSDIVKSRGPLSGIYTALKVSNTELNYFIACDMPNINMNFIDYMYKRIVDKKEKLGIVGKRDDFLEPMNSFYRKILFYGETDIFKKNIGVNKFLENKDIIIIEKNILKLYSENLSMFDNLNTPKELEDWRNKNFEFL